MHLHLKIKLRAFGITFGTLEETRDVTAAMTALFKGANLPKPGQPVTLYDDRGVLIQLL